MNIETNSTQTRVTPAQETLQALWEVHMASEFVQHDADAAIATMVPDAYVNDIPVMIGGVELDEVHEFYEVVPKNWTGG